MAENCEHRQLQLIEEFASLARMAGAKYWPRGGRALDFLRSIAGCSYLAAPRRLQPTTRL
jgi:hypothetical protein